MSVVKCDDCEVTVINGIACHEHGCPSSWKDGIRECKWCGQKFKSESSGQGCCSEECREAYYG